MPALQVLSTRPLSGKTTTAVALGQALSRAGATLRLIRAGSAAAADADALTFGACLFASSPGRPLPAEQLGALPANETVLIELDAAAPPLRDLPALIVIREAPSEADLALGQAVGERLLGTIALRVAGGRTQAVAHDLMNGGLRPLAILPEDRALAAPSVDEIRIALGATLYYDGENGAEVVEDVLLAPVYADPARPHFGRFASKAVLAPFNKTDLHLVAIETQAACLVITGGQQPSPYVRDRAQGESTTVLLTESNTPEALAALSDVWLTSRFQGKRKAAVALALIERSLDIAGLAKKIAG